MAPRPGRIHKEYSLPFASMGLKQDLREIKKDKDFSKKRRNFRNDLEYGRGNYGKRKLDVASNSNLFDIFCCYRLYPLRRRLIKTEKVDAVFGNPERALEELIG